MARFMVFVRRRTTPDVVGGVDVDEDASLAERNRQLLSEFEMDVVDQYYLTSKYWAVLVVEAPDSRTVAQAIRAVTGPGDDPPAEFVPVVAPEESEG